MTRISTSFHYLLGIGLSIWCIGNLLDGLDVHNWYELIIGDIIVIGPAALGLLLLSLNLLRHTNGWGRRAAFVGLATGVGSVMWAMGQLAYVLIVYY